MNVTNMILRYENGQVINGSFNEAAFDFEEISDENLFWKIHASYKDDSISSSNIENDDKDNLKARNPQTRIGLYRPRHGRNCPRIPVQSKY